MTEINVRIRVLQDTAANFTSNNPVLLKGEWGWEEDTGKVKIGDGTTAWNSLAYKIEAVFTSTEKSKLAGIEEGADVTDATNVAAAGAVMSGDTILGGDSTVS